MKKIKLVKPIKKDENGELVFDICCDEANSNWIRAARLAKTAKEGDKIAGKKLKKMENTPMYRVSDD